MLQMNAQEARKAVQRILGVQDDGQIGAKSRAVFERLAAAPDDSAWPAPVTPPAVEIEHHVKASSFADPADVAAFRRCKERGKSDEECFRIGDNGIGLWGDRTSEGSGPSCAIIPEDMIERWGSINGAKHRSVHVTANGHSIIAICKDRMPHRDNVENGAGIDLNPDSCRLLGVEPPMMIPAVWKWA